MAITSSAKKAIRSSARKRFFNMRRKSGLAGMKKKIQRFLKEGKKKEAHALLPQMYQAVDKAAKSYLNKNTAARIKSRLTLLVHKSLK